MKIVQGFPPNYKKIEKKFHPPRDMVFTYGDTIFVPYIDLESFEFPDHLMVHEQIHEKQQGSDPAKWWDQYMVDVKFRFKQELEAYRNQYKFGLKHYPREKVFKWGMSLARDLSGDAYGNCVDFNKAFDMIKS